MQCYKRYIFYFIFLLLPGFLYAKEAFPKGCVPIVLSQNTQTVILKLKPPAIVMLHNLTDNDLWVIHPVSEFGVSAGWSTRIESDKWTALNLSYNEFALNCIESIPGHEQQVQCSEVLAACSYDNVTESVDPKFATTYFIAENLILPETVALLLRQGYTNRY